MVNGPLPHPIVSDSAVLEDTPVFADTRVPAQTLLDYLIAGDGLEAFLEQYPSVSHQQALAALQLMRDALSTPP